MWNKLKEQFNYLKLEKKKLCLITDSKKFESKELFVDAIASALQGGVDIVQLKENSFPDDVLVEIAKKIRVICDEFGATFIVNGRCDIAQIAEADGVHLEERCVSIQDARYVLGENSIIGVSAKSTDDVIRAFNEGADYVTFGPVNVDKKSNNTISIDDIIWVNENIEIPIFITGDITLDNINLIVQSGIYKIAVTDPVMYAKIPEETARNLTRFLP